MADEELNTRERRFVEAYCGDAGFVIAEAARQAGYADSTAYKIAPLWIGKNRDSKYYKPHVVAAIEDRLDAMSMSAAEATLRHTEIARADFADFYQIVEDEEGNRHAVLDLVKLMEEGPSYLVKKIKWTKYGPTIESYDAQAAQKTIMKAHGLFGAKGTEGDPVHTVTTTITEEERQRRLDELREHA